MSDNIHRGQSYALYICILVLSVLALALSGSAPVVLTCCLMGAAIGVLLLYQTFIGRHQARLTAILASGLLIGYCGGCAITQIFCGLDQSGVTEAGWNTVPPIWVGFTIKLALGSSSLLLCAASVEPAIFKKSDRILVTWQIERLLWIAVSVLAFGVISGSFGYMGAYTQEGSGRVGVLAEISNELLMITAPLSIAGVLQSSGWRRYRFALIAVFAFIVAIPAGRRDFAYDVIVTIFIASRLSGVRVNLSKAVKWMWFLTAIMIVAVTGFIFMGLRMASGLLGPGKHSVAEIVGQASRTVADNPRDVIITTAENLESRPFLLTQYLSLLTKGGNDVRLPMYGADISQAVKMDIPDVIYTAIGRSKDPVREVGAEEGVANEHFNLPVFDDANSILTGGWIDFGLAGVLLYPLILCFLWRAISFAVGEILGATARFIVLLVAINICLQAEIDLGGYIVSLRDAGIIAGAWALLSLLPRFTASRQIGLSVSVDHDG
ncbi:MAG: hypothetical protein ACLGXA_03505 [Acidobacteriota bacterium]